MYKRNFFLFKKLIHSQYYFQHATWNFSEAEHGKGVPDGIGATVKRTTDIIVMGGIFPTCMISIEKLPLRNSYVLLYLVKPNAIHDMDTIIPLHKVI